ncbi:hypothetical protein DPMN_059687 [Dreissena polymorpha]|uniref:Uncharacterized protein n=1 Tax=Dreissena polymorpha TaxID=45954 RepID=A0A9D4C4L4_DREPO|nr:hypothetical protein DPMN_059687 [Dreissena polymorpha]
MPSRIGLDPYCIARHQDGCDKLATGLCIDQFEDIGNSITYMERKYTPCVRQ